MILLYIVLCSYKIDFCYILLVDREAGAGNVTFAWKLQLTRIRSYIHLFIYILAHACSSINSKSWVWNEHVCIYLRCFVVRCCFIIILCVFVKRLNSSSLTVDYSKLLPSQTLFIKYSYAGNSFRLGRNKILFIKQVYSPFLVLVIENLSCCYYYKTSGM